MKKQLIILGALGIAGFAFVGCHSDATMNEPAGAEIEQRTTIEDSSGPQGTMDAESELNRDGRRSSRGLGTSGSAGTSTGDSSDGSASGNSTGGTSSGSSSGSSSGGSTQP